MTWSISGFSFPQDFSILNPQTALDVISLAKKVHITGIVISAAMLGCTGFMWKEHKDNEEQIAHIARKLDSNFNNELLREHLSKCKDYHESRRALLVAVSCIFAGLFCMISFVTYKNWKDYHVVAFPTLQQIASELPLN